MHTFGNHKGISVYRVRCDSVAERLRMAELLESLGLPVSGRAGDPEAPLHSPTGTPVFDIHLTEGRADYSPPPFICAAMITAGVRFYTVAEFERLAAAGFGPRPRFPVFHVPHDGSEFPEELMASVCVPRETFHAYHEAMRDLSVGDLIPGACGGPHMRPRFPVSRLLCDVERLLGPEEIMERYGMGFCYERAFDGSVIKRVTPRARAAARRYYDEHHARMNRLCAAHPRMVFFDMHSYHDRILPPFARESGEPSPDLCLGTDPRFTPPRLRDIILRRFGEAGFTVAENRPYGGLYVPETVMDGSGGCDFIGVMLEFHRRAYCGGDGLPDPERTGTIREVLKLVLADCVLLP